MTEPREVYPVELDRTFQGKDFRPQPVDPSEEDGPKAPGSPAQESAPSQGAASQTVTDGLEDLNVPLDAVRENGPTLTPPSVNL